MLKCANNRSNNINIIIFKAHTHTHTNSTFIHAKHKLKEVNETEIVCVG